MTAHIPIPERSLRSTGIAIDPHLIEEARILGIDLSRTGEDGLAGRIEKARLERQWRAENAGAIASWNAYVEAHGLPLADISVF